MAKFPVMVGEDDLEAFSWMIDSGKEICNLVLFNNKSSPERREAARLRLMAIDRIKISLGSAKRQSRRNDED